MGIDGRVVVITGATGGLGRVVARSFAERGARLALVSGDQAKLDAQAQELGLPAERVLVHAADLRDPAAVSGAARAVTEQFGGADVLLHLVGGWVGGKPIAETDPSDLASMLDQHVWTTFHLLRAFVPILVARGWGRIVVVSATGTSRPAAKMGAYAAAKAAEEMLIQTVAREMAGQGVTANVLQARAIDVEHKRDSEPSATNASWTTPEEIAAAMLYLCSEEAGPVSGERLSLAGAEL
ncbi:MAG TPA: SDR family NAD(P)-dependent oxidoreductase [Thermomicrobiales bacterium]